MFIGSAGRLAVDLVPRIGGVHFIAFNPPDDVEPSSAVSVVRGPVPLPLRTSMAGHDTQQAARRCPSAMFFIPSIDGVSHNPDENSHEEDILLAGVLMDSWADRWIAECS